MKSVLTGTVFLLLVVAANANDSVPIVEPAYKLDPRVAPNPSTVHGQWNSRVNVIAWWVNLWGKKSINKQVTAAIEAQMSKQEVILKWRGGGVLLNARIIRAQKTDSPLQPLGILGEGAHVIGYGKSPEEALIAHWGTAKLDQGIPPGWALDEVMSAYIWVELLNGRRVIKGIPSGTMLGLHKDVRENFPQLFQKWIEGRSDNLNSWIKVADYSKRRITERVAKAAIDKSLQMVTESHKRVIDSNRRLKEALERDQKLGEAILMLKTLQGVLTVTQLVSEVSSLMDENPQSFSNANSAAAVISKAEEIHEGHRIYTLKVKAEFDGSSRDLKGFVEKLWVAIQPASPPSEVKDVFLLP